jgi:microcompartment protein CcmK/EutM
MKAVLQTYQTQKLRKSKLFILEMIKKAANIAAFLYFTQCVMGKLIQVLDKLSY